MKNRWFYPFLVVLFGLLTAQAISTAQVYLSNVALYRTLVTVKEAGYLPIPNERTMPHLQQFGPAFFGGLFFTLTVGAGLSLLTLAAAWIWDRIFHREKTILIPCFVFWLGFLMAVNYRGFSPMVTLYFLFIPLVVFFATLKTMPPRKEERIWPGPVLHIITLLVLASLWRSQIDDHPFLNLRDTLLLSNPLGTKVTDFYYKYTCYPTNVLESLDQRTVKTLRLEHIQEESAIWAVEKELISQDYLNVGTNVPVDLRISSKGDHLLFENRGRAILQTTQADFLSDPEAVLKKFSKKGDKYGFFRHQVIHKSLLIGFPITLYVFLYTLLRLVLNALLGPRAAPVTASALCIITVTGLLVIFSLSLGGVVAEENVQKALQSEYLGERVAALKIIEQKRLEIANYQAYRQLLTSPHVPERYWIVNALSVSRRSETLKDLMAFLDDPHSNVVSRTFYALGRRGEKKAIQEILRRIETSTDWRNQRLAYEALRRLGWKQSKSS